VDRHDDEGRCHYHQSGSVDECLAQVKGQRGLLTTSKTSYWPPKTADELVRAREPIGRPYPRSGHGSVTVEGAPRCGPMELPETGQVPGAASPFSAAQGCPVPTPGVAVAGCKKAVPVRSSVNTLHVGVSASTVPVVIPPPLGCFVLLPSRSVHRTVLYCTLPGRWRSATSVELHNPPASGRSPSLLVPSAARWHAPAGLSINRRASASEPGQLPPTHPPAHAHAHARQCLQIGWSLRRPHAHPIAAPPLGAVPPPAPRRRTAVGDRRAPHSAHRPMRAREILGCRPSH